MSCFVNFANFAEFAKHWLNALCEEGNNWCRRADLDYSGDVDLEDIKILAYYWLCECPGD